jgi:hypothetical protein
MIKSGLADNPLFMLPEKSFEQPALPNPPALKQEIEHDRADYKEQSIEEQPVNQDTHPPRNQDTAVPRYQDTTIEWVRKVVKEFGKEAATHRFTVAEKKEIADLIYAFKNRGVKTCENEITRIALNFILQDYRENGENSLLDRVLKALND